MNSSRPAVELPGAFPLDSPEGSPPLPGIDCWSVARCFARAGDISPSLLVAATTGVVLRFEDPPATNTAPTATSPTAASANASRVRLSLSGSSSLSKNPWRFGGAREYRKRSFPLLAREVEPPVVAAQDVARAVRVLVLLHVDELEAELAADRVRRLVVHGRIGVEVPVRPLRS